MLAKHRFVRFNKNFFDYDLVKLQDKNEYGLPQTIVKMSQDYSVNIEKTKNWLQINDLSGLKRAELALEKYK